MQRKVRHDIAMTGELTLQGKVLPIGGLKEKMLAAKRAGIHKLIVPEENRESIAECSAEILSGMDITFVTDVSQVLEKVVMPAKEK